MKITGAIHRVRFEEGVKVGKKRSVLFCLGFGMKATAAVAMGHDRKRQWNEKQKKRLSGSNLVVRIDDRNGFAWQ